MSEQPFDFGPVPSLPPTVAVARRPRMQHIAPRLPYTDRKFLLDGKYYVMQAAPPHGNPQDVRKAQRLLVSVVYPDRNYEQSTLTYQEVCEILSEDFLDQTANRPCLPLEYSKALSDFRLAVETAIPYTAANLVHDVGLERIMEVLGLESSRPIQERVRNATDWQACELALLKVAFPEFDVDATVKEQLFWMAALRKGMFSRKASGDTVVLPTSVVQHAIGRGILPQSTNLYKDKEV